MTDASAGGPAETPPLDPASLIAAAQQSAAAGDYAAAERLLRDAVAKQEATLGSSHPDLATTLNNLAFVCERTSKFDESERGYRRAHAIAVASLSPGHPFIKTSLSNLVDFCESRGIPIWTPPETPVEDEPLPDDVDEGPSEVDVAPDVVVEPTAVPELAISRLPLRRTAAAVLGVAAVVVILLAVGGKLPAQPPRQAQGTTDGAPSVPARKEPVPPAAPAQPTSDTAPVPLHIPEPADVTPEPRELVNTNVSVTVLAAQLCSAIEKRGSPDWQCTPASGDLQPGTFMFYTRLLTTAATVVEHRWYRGDRVHQVMRLRVSASPGNGFRTFSSTTVSPERAGDWKVELRTADGSLLDEARFVVR